MLSWIETENKNTKLLTRSRKVERITDGIETVDAERDQYKCGAICHRYLNEPDQLASNVARTPWHGQSPNDVGEYVQQANKQI